MSGLLHLTLTEPLRIVLDDSAVASLRAEDASGGFGILPGHADFLTVIDAGVLHWRGTEGPWHFAALRGAVLSVSGGTEVRIAAREAIRGEDLAALGAEVARSRAQAEEERRRTRTDSAKLQARAIRHLMRELAQGGDGLSAEDLQ